MKRVLTLSLAATFGLFTCAGLAIAQEAKEPAKETAKAPAKDSKKLAVGDSAPKLQLSKFVKGEDVKEFQTGQVYVVEFWATWCGPCKATIPHLTEMAKKMKGKATFIGVSVWERGEDIEDQVKKFVKTMGEKMDYNIALDDGQKMSETWMMAAGKNGIPCAFVVDKAGKIAWIGHPATDLERVVGEVVEGKFDVKAEAERAKQQAEKEAKINEERKAAAGKVRELNAKLRDAQLKEDWKGAVAVIDEMAAADKTRASMYNALKFDMMSKFDKPGAYAFARTMAENELKNDENTLNTLAWRLVEDDATDKGGYELALDLSKKSNDLSKHENGMYLDTLAYCHYRLGDFTKAIELQEKAVKLIKKMEEADDSMVSEMEERLEKFKKAKN